MKSPPKKKPLLAGEREALSKLKVRAEYQAFNFLARAFAGPFWYFEQKRSQAADQIAANESKSVLIETAVARYVHRKRGAARRSR
jgi:hypothetical protein